MIQLSDFDYDTARLSIKHGSEEGEVLIRSEYTQEAIKANTKFNACLNAAKEQGIDMEVEVDNFGIKTKEVTETYNKLLAQYAEQLVIEWPFKDVNLFDALCDNPTLARAVIDASKQRAEEFLKKKIK